MYCEMDAKDGDNEANKETHKGISEEKHTLDAFITSPQQTPRFTDPYSASLYQTPEGSTEYLSPCPASNPKDDSSSEPSDNQGDQSLSGEDDTEDDRKSNRYRNPEPPKELLEQHIVDADNIGNTVYSKCWVFATLMNLLKAVEEQNAVDKDKEEVVEEEEKDDDDDDGSTGGERATTVPVELEDGLQDDLCKLWDMSMNQEVVNFLVEHNAIDLLTGVIAKSKAPRATEICIGIIGNMACSPDVCHLLGSNTELVNLVWLLLESPDAPTLVETMRLLHVCVSSSRSELWLLAIKDASIIYDQVLFIFQSSTNLDLLKHTAEFIDKLMEVDEDICSQLGNPELVVAIMEAIKQTGSHVSHILETFLHVLQLVSTSEQGVQSLATYCGQVCMLIIGYLKHICTDEIVGVEGHENIIGSALSILCVIFGVWEDRMHFLQTDFQLFRCTLKILDVVYPKHMRLPHALRNSRDRSGSVSVNSVSGNDVDPISGKRSSSVEDNSDVTERANETPVIVELEPAADKLHPREGEELEKMEDKLENADSVEQTSDKLKGETKTGDSDDANSPSTDAKRDEEYKREMTNMLYEVLQTMLSELVSMLAKLPVSEAKETNGDRIEPMNEAEASAEDPNAEELPRIPMCLVYLEKLCDRHRLQYMLKMLSDVVDKDCIGLLYTTGQKHGLKRLCRVIDGMNLRTE